MKILIVFLILVFSINVFAQNNNVQNEILDYSDSKSEVISKGRRLLLDKFIEGDIEKVQEIKDYLLSDIENQDYLAFYPVEYWFILYWTQEYNDLLNHLVTLDTLNSGYFQRMIKPEYDLLFEKIRNESRNSRLLLELNINNSNLKQIEKISFQCI